MSATSNCSASRSNTATARLGAMQALETYNYRPPAMEHLVILHDSWVFYPSSNDMANF